MKSSTSWKPGHVSLHNLSAAGRKSKRVSPWGRAPCNANALRTIRLEAIKRAAGKVR